MRFRPRLLPLVFVLAGVAVLIGLGTWQLQRLAWKTALIEDRRQALALPPVAISAIPPDAEDARFRRVAASGRFLYGAEMHLVARTHQGQAGMDIVTPLVLADGTVLFVDRGWVPQTAVNPAARAAGQVDGVVTVTGVLRQGGRPNFWTPDNAPGKNDWYYLDTTEMAQAIGAPQDSVHRLYLAADATPNPGGLPIGRKPNPELRNAHLGYAITWYALAVAMLVIYLLANFKRDASE